MKAACLLVCLGLAHSITGSIFEPKTLENFLAQPLEYIKANQDQNQQQSQESYQKVQDPQRNQPLSTRFQQQKQSEENLKLQQQSEEFQNRQQQSDETQTLQSKQQRVQQQSQYSQKSEESQQKVKRFQSQSEESLHRQKLPQSQQKTQTQYQQNQDWSQQQSEESQNKHHQHRSKYQQQDQDSESHHTQKRWKHSHHKKAHSDSSSSESQSKEKTNNDAYILPLHNTKKWNTIDATAVTYDNMGQDIGNVIMWQNQNPMPVIPFYETNKDDVDRIFADAQKAMKHIRPEDKVMFHEAYEFAVQKENEDIMLNATELAMKHQYPVEEHIIKTDDGYLLTVFRIVPKKYTRDVQKRPVAFLMHGLLGSADDWLLMGPGKSLAYLLADEGYDVWLGNARGNKYSNKHVSRHPAMSDFWQFSTDEIALHDLPAMINYTLKATNQEKLYYIGHSLGTTAFFALTSTMPEYNDKIFMMYALSPVVYMGNTRSPLLRIIAPTSQFSESFNPLLGQGAFKPNKELIRVVGGAMCEEEIGCKEVCSNVNFVMAGVNVEGLDSDVIPVILSHLPAGTSTKVIKHFSQGVASEEFRKYDHGPEVNEMVYGTLEPPKYDMKNVRAPVTLIYSEEDWLAHPQDVERLQRELPNVNEAVKVADDHFNHMDFQFSKKAPEFVYKGLIECMEKHQRY